MQSELAACRFALREWKSKAQEKITEAEALYRRVRKLERHIRTFLDANDASEMSNVAAAIQRLRRDIEDI